VIIEWVSRIWPSMIVEDVPLQAPKPPQHWGLSARHKKDVEQLWVNQLGPLAPFYGVATLAPLLAGTLGTPSLAQLLTRTIQLVRLRHGHSQAANTLLTVLAQIAVLIAFDFKRFVEEGGAVPKQLGPMLALFSRMAEDRVSSTATALTNMRRRLLVAKEKEKDHITDYLKDMSDEQRDIENHMKNNKLGRWAKGQSKELYSYTQAGYDTEMAELEQREADDVQLQDAIGRARVGREIDELYEDPDIREAMDMGDIAEDNDGYGEVDDDDF